MARLKIEGHDEVLAQFRSALEQKRLAHTFLFVGPNGVGKRTLALFLAQALLCENRDEKLLDSCGACAACVQLLAGTNPDLLMVSRPAGKSFIPLGLIKGDEPDYPVHNSLLFQLGLRPFGGRRKVGIIDDADFLNQEGANCLLKTLEEPPPRSLLILISTSADRQLPTIRSRAQIVRFRPLSDVLLAKLLVEQHLVASADEAQRLAAFSGGSLQRATEMADPQLWTFRSDLLKRLAELPRASTSLGQTVTKFVDEAGKEAPPRRARLRLSLGFAAEFFRQLMRKLSGLDVVVDTDLAQVIQRAASQSVWNADTAGSAAQRTLEAINQVDRNANQSLVVEAWLDELSGLCGALAVQR
jgi:DNA polymerase III subunit delta'